ncbi:YXWGXW repeat-containing protein [Dyella sp. 20L07]|uniref:YXWGXW repeat-containing protein n=1 Tax=Dyella sp. 20L07 TaxID=3384240 RepID=UPI003D2862F5
MEQRQLDGRVSRHRLLYSMIVVLGFATCAAVPLTAEAGVSIGVGISVGVPPPALPIYAQPVIPGPGYIWVPGYWAYSDDGYYWVPGTWVMPPYVGALWTPGYWGWAGGVYVFHGGYWGAHVGFYGGINYGFGYTGVGYVGGYWRNGGFYYNRSVNRIDNVHITNVYNRTVNNITVNRTSFNGGQGGLTARPSAQEMSFAREQHAPPVAAQMQQGTLASRDPSMRASFNHGAPAMAATPRAGVFNAQGAEAARGAGASGQPSPASFSTQRANTTMQAPHNDMALHSAGFAPHAASAAQRGNAGSSAEAGHAAYAGQAPQQHAYQASRQPSYAHAQTYHPQAYRAPAARPAAHAPAQHAAAPRGGASHEERH